MFRVSCCYVFLLLLCTSSWAAPGSPKSSKATPLGCYVELEELPSDTKIASRLQKTVIPDHFDWKDQVTLTPPTNQFIPSPCGSCWAHASTGALTDRIILGRVKNRDLTPVVPLSPQVLLDCKDDNLGSCHGGSAVGAYAFIKTNGITDITCSPYFGADNVYWAELGGCGNTMCRNCDRFGNCGFVNGTKYYVSHYGLVIGEGSMKEEIYHGGPIACSVYAHSNPFENYKEGIIQDSGVYNTTTHVVVITGWGVSASGMQYWSGRNSYGTTWGEGGWFKLQRGVNTLDIETHTCAWATPKMPL